MPDSRHGPIYLPDLVKAARVARDSSAGLSTFLGDRDTEGVHHWPDDVCRQWLYDHADHNAFLDDYGLIDLTTIAWRVETVPLEALITMPTGSSESDLIEYYAKEPEHWVNVRNQGGHIGVREMWEVHGTWKRWPILIDQALVNAQLEGLQVVEGRTRIGVLRGRTRLGLHVARNHLAWVGRARF